MPPPPPPLLPSPGFVIFSLVPTGIAAIQSALQRAQAAARAKAEALKVQQSVVQIAALDRVRFAADRTAVLQGKYVACFFFLCFFSLLCVLFASLVFFLLLLFFIEIPCAVM